MKQDTLPTNSLMNANILSASCLTPFPDPVSPLVPMRIPSEKQFFIARKKAAAKSKHTH